MTNVQHTIKRLFDIAAASVGLLISFPVMLVISIGVKFSSKGPLLYVQERIGRHGKVFRCVKFRTMVTNADRLGTVTAANDKRITAIGRILRNAKLDELPQLWNVLIGNMSFVGPRPDVPGYADTITGENRIILDLRPGMTGPATLYFRYEEELLAKVADPQRFNDEILWPRKVEINAEYYRNWSFIRDIGFMLITIFPFLNTLLRLLPSPPRGPLQL